MVLNSDLTACFAIHDRNVLFDMKSPVCLFYLIINYRLQTSVTKGT